MNDLIREYYKPKAFFQNNVAYLKHKDIFEECLNFFNESELLKESISGLKIDDDKNMADIQVACGLIFSRCQQFLISLLRLCNEGNLEDAAVLLRALFEHYVQMKYIIQNDYGTLFLNFRWVSHKRYIDAFEMHNSESDLIGTENYNLIKERIIEKYEIIKNDYKTKRGKLQDHWYKGNMSILADSIGSGTVYNFLKHFASPFVHCDISGMTRFISGDEDRTIFDNSPTTESLDIVLNMTKIFFGKVATELAGIYGVETPKIFRIYLKSQNNMDSETSK